MSLVNAVIAYCIKICVNEVICFRVAQFAVAYNNQTEPTKIVMQIKSLHVTVIARMDINIARWQKLNRPKVHMGHTRNVPQGAVFSKRHWYQQRQYRMLRYGGPWELIWSALATVTQMSYGAFTMLSWHGNIPRSNGSFRGIYRLIRSTVLYEILYIVRVCVCYKNEIPFWKCLPWFSMHRIGVLLFWHKRISGQCIQHQHNTYVYLQGQGAVQN